MSVPRSIDDVIDSMERKLKGELTLTLVRDDYENALRYLHNYRDKLRIEEAKRDEDCIDAIRYAMMDYSGYAKLTWGELQSVFGKPVYCKNKKDDKARWIILWELHTTERGRFVISTDEKIYPVDDWDFYEREMV